MSEAGFEPAIQASERVQTHILDCTATGIGEIACLAQTFWQFDM
jgi:hypothetical protein